MTTMYKAVIFDLDDTLYEYKTINKIAIEKLCKFTCKKFDTTEEDFEKAFLWARMNTKDILGNTGASHNRILYCQKILEYMGKNPVDGAHEMYDCYWNSMLKDMKLQEGTISLLKRLKADGLKIAICTDLTALIQHRKILTLGLVPFVDVLVTSEEAGVEKPNEKIYSLVLEKLKLPASSCLFVGDSQEKDVDAPKRVGMDSVLYTNMKAIEEYIYRRNEI